MASNNNSPDSINDSGMFTSSLLMWSVWLTAAVLAFFAGYYIYVMYGRYKFVNTPIDGVEFLSVLRESAEAKSLDSWNLLLERMRKSRIEDMEIYSTLITQVKEDDQYDAMIKSWPEV